MINLPIGRIVMKRPPEQRISSLLSRVSIFLFFLNLVLGFIYVIGSVQEFLDTTQGLILRVFEVSSITFIILAIYSLVLMVMEMIRWKRNYTVALLITVIGITIVLTLFVGVEFILVIQETVE